MKTPPFMLSILKAFHNFPPHHLLFTILSVCKLPDAAYSRTVVKNIYFRIRETWIQILILPNDLGQALNLFDSV